MGFKLREKKEFAKSEVVVEKGYKAMEIMKITDKAIGTAKAKKYIFTLKEVGTENLTFVDVIYKNKLGEEIRFTNNLLNDIVDCSGIDPTDVVEFGFETALKGMKIGAILDVEEDEYNGKVTKRAKLVGVLNPYTLENAFGKANDTYWFERLDIEFPTEALKPEDRVVATLDDEEETDIVKKVVDVFGEEDEDEMPF